MNAFTVLLMIFCQFSFLVWAYDAPQVCNRQPYKQIECLKQYLPAKSFCAKNYPIPPTTKTSTARAVTVTKTKGITTITNGVSTKTVTLPTSTVLKETTTYTTLTLLSGQKGKRNAQRYTASLYSSLIARQAAMVRTACACIQTPSTRTVWTTPTSTTFAKKTVYVRGTTTKSIRPTTTKYRVVTQTVTIYSTTLKGSNTSASATTRSSTPTLTTRMSTTCKNGYHACLACSHD